MTKSTPPQIAGAGFFAVDVVLGREGDVLASSLGGSAGNVLSILSAFGWRSMPFAVLGQDRPASNLEARWDALGMDRRFVQKSSNRSTPVVFQHQLDPSCGRTHRYSFSCPKCGHSSQPRHDAARAHFLTTIRQEPDVDFFYFDRATLDNVELAEHFAQRGALVVFEPSLVGDDFEIFRRAIRSADIVKYADDRLDDIEDLGVSQVPIEIQTMGSKGLKVRVSKAAAGAWIKVDAFELPGGVVDAAGSGDWCTVGIIRALAGVTRSSLGQLSLERLISATVYGQALAALNCLTVGAQGLLKRLPANKFRDPLEGMACGYPRGGAHHLVGSAGLSDIAWGTEEILSALAWRSPSGSDLFPCCSS